LYREDYYKRIEGFIDFALLNPKNISGGRIKCSCVKCENKKFHQLDVVMMHLLKKGSLRNTSIGLHTENPMFLKRPC
jgi:hypothetical protein